MTQKYSILWFEDSRELVESLVPSIKDYLESLGFDLSHEVRPDDSKLAEIVKDVDPDLILVDYDLGAGKKGDELVDKIRDLELYQDVVFYSQKYDDFVDRISRKLEGVFFTERKNLLEKTYKIIERTVKKQQDVNNMRGVIIAEAVDIERKMDALITTCLGTDEERKGVVEKILDPEFDVLSFKNKYDLINRICRERIKALARLHEKAKPEEKEGILAIKSKIEQKKSEFVQAYKEVIEIRNIMAHAKEDPKSKNTLISYLRKDEPIAVDDEFCRNTRKNLRKHSENLDALIKLWEVKMTDVSN